jgi:hypothetical protein
MTAQNVNLYRMYTAGGGSDSDLYLLRLLFAANGTQFLAKTLILSNLKIINVKTAGVLVLIIAIIFIIVILATFFFFMRLSMFIFPTSQALDMEKTSLSSWKLVYHNMLSKQPLLPQIETISSLVIQLPIR